VKVTLDLGNPGMAVEDVILESNNINQKTSPNVQEELSLRRKLNPPDEVKGSYIEDQS
jgi:hypothetical protein